MLFYYYKLYNYQNNKFLKFKQNYVNKKILNLI